MKNLLLAIAFIGFIATSSFATATALTKSVDTVQCDDNKDCDKKSCKKGDKKSCKKGAKKSCKKGNKKTCKKGEAKKACCSKDKVKSEKTTTDVKKGE